MMMSLLKKEIRYRRFKIKTKAMNPDMAESFKSRDT
jgi:hypothetical protein